MHSVTWRQDDETSYTALVADREAARLYRAEASLLWQWELPDGQQGSGLSLPREQLSVVRALMRQRQRESPGGPQEVTAAQPWIVYHGTTSRNLRSILKNGLVPNPKQRRWDSDPDTGFGRPSRESYSGVYFARRLMSAVSAATNAKHRFGGEGIIVIAQLQPKSALPDEDSFTVPVGRCAAQAFRDVWNSTVVESTVVSAWACSCIAAGKYVDLAYDSDKAVSWWAALLAAFKTALVEQPQFRTAAKSPKFSIAAEQLFIGWLERNAAWSAHSDYDWRVLVNGTRTFGSRESYGKIQQPDRAASEQQFRTALDAFMRTARDLHIIEDDPSSGFNNVTMRSLEPIRFSGANKILAIVQQVSHHDRNSRLPKGSYGYVVLYGTVPEEFKRQAQEQNGRESQLWTKEEFARLIGGEQTVVASAGLRPELQILLDAVNISEDDAAVEMAFNNGYYVAEWLDSDESPDGAAERLYKSAGDKYDYWMENEPYCFVDVMQRSDQISYGRYIAEHHANADPSSTPMHTVFSRAVEEPEQWLIHFGDDAGAIERHGFQYGIGDGDIDKLALTTSWTQESKKRPGYVFSYTLSAAKRYAFYRGRPKYGKEAVMFRAAGVTMWHSGDEEAQTIVWGPDAKDFVALYPSTEGGWYLSDVGGEEHSFDDIWAATAWVEQNWKKPQKKSKNVKAAADRDLGAAFDRLNAELWDGKLTRPVQFRWDNRKTAVMSVMTTTDRLTGRLLGVPLLRASRLFSMDDETFLNLLVHEMVHIEVNEQNRRESALDSRAHGPIFKKAIDAVRRRSRYVPPYSETDVPVNESAAKPFIVMWMLRRGQHACCSMSEQTFHRFKQELTEKLDRMREAGVECGLLRSTASMLSGQPTIRTVQSGKGLQLWVASEQEWESIVKNGTEVQI